MKARLLIFFLFISYIGYGASVPYLYDTFPHHEAESIAKKKDSVWKHTYIYMYAHSGGSNDTALSKEKIERGDGRIRDVPAGNSLYASLFILALLGLAIVQLTDPGYMYYVISSVMNFGQLMNIFQDGRFGFSLLNLNLDFLFILSLGVIIEKLFFPYHPEYFVWVMVFTAGAYFLKLILIQLFAYLFFDRLDAILHLLFQLLFTRITGIIMLPAVFFSLYQTHFNTHGCLHFIFVFLLVVYTLWLIRLLVKMKTEGISGIFYLILYLCTLEVFPILILLKSFLV